MNILSTVSIAITISAAALLGACTTAPSAPMGATHATTMATPNQMAKMDMQMQTMRDMHEKMKGAKSPSERNKLMGDHMKAMQDGMAMMGDMKDMPAMPAMSGDMAAHHQMMAKRMEMMQTMMKMMMDRMPPALAM